jgi:hypothetical protein
MHSTFVVGMIFRVSKIDQLNVFVVPFFSLALQASNGNVLLQ